MRAALPPLLLLIAVAPWRDAAAAPPAACPARGSAVLVDTRARELRLCEEGGARARFPVALGHGGLGKRREGDGRTPLGIYPLGAPRPSRLYGTFVPIGYPTAIQARVGFSGNAVGIHGPPRGAGLSSTATDWTAGCIAVGSDGDIAAIAAWVRARGRPSIQID